MIAIIALLLEIGILAINNLGKSPISNTTATFLILLFSFFFFGAIGKDHKLNDYKSALRIGYLLRLFLLYFDLYGRRIYVLPNSAADSEMFYLNAVYFSQGYPFRSGTYIRVLGRLFRLIGTNRLYGQFLSMLCSVVALIFLAYSLHELDLDKKTRQRVYLVICLLPNCAILHSILIREAIICMFLTMSFYSFIKWYKNRSSKDYLIAMALVLPAAAFHSGTMAVIIGYIVIRFFYGKRSEHLNVNLRNIVVALFFVLAVVFLINNTGNQFTAKFANLDSIEDIANTGTGGRSSYARYVGNSNNPVNLVIYTIPRIIYFLFSPFPWQWRGLSDIIAFCFSSLFYIVTLLRAFKYLRQRDQSNRILVALLLIIAVTTVFVFAWGTSNTGTATRHRDKLVTLFALILALSSSDMNMYASRRNYHNTMRTDIYG